MSKSNEVTPPHTSRSEQFTRLQAIALCEAAAAVLSGYLETHEGGTLPLGARPLFTAWLLICKQADHSLDAGILAAGYKTFGPVTL